MTDELRPLKVSDIIFLRPVLFPKHPRITKLESGHGSRCEGYRWSQMSIKAANDPGGLKEKYRCKAVGLWQFKALPYSKRKQLMSATTGTYCFVHLLAEMRKPREDASFTAWWTRELAKRGIDATDRGQRYTSREEAMMNG